MSLCSVGGGNTGRPNCYPIFDVAKQFVFVEYFKDDGTINGIQISVDLTSNILSQTFLDSKVKNIDTNLRWYPTPELKNVTNERGESMKETFEDQSSVFIQEGARTITGMIVKGEPILLGNLKEWKFKTAGFYIIDKSGNLIGNGGTSDYLYPIRIEDESFDPTLVMGTDTTKQKNMISFVVSQLEKDEDLRMIEAANITATLLGVNGLIDVNITGSASSISTTGFTAQLDTEFGGLGSLIAAEGMDKDDFYLYNNTTAAAVTILTCTESATTPGSYSFTFAAQSSADVLTCSNVIVNPIKKNFDLNSFNITIP